MVEPLVAESESLRYRGIAPENWASQVKLIFPRGMGSVVVFSVVLFVLSHIIEPLYFSNQNTKFLHGLARAFPDRLGADWTAGTVDGLPMFSALVFVIARWGQPVLFEVMEAALLAVFAVAIGVIGAAAAPRSGGTARLRLFLGAVFAVLAAPLFKRVLAGVAGQYVLGGFLQPSEFGVLFFAAIACHIREHRRAALLLAVAPAVMLPAYIPIAAIIFSVLAWSGRAETGGWPSLSIILIGVACLAAPEIDLALRFPASSPALAERATEIIAFRIIPYHSSPSVWFRAAEAPRLVLVLAAWAVSPLGAVKRILGGLLIWAVGGAVAEAMTHHAGLALLAPWRASVVLIPMALAVLCGRAYDTLNGHGIGRRALGLGTAAVLALAMGFAIVGALRKVKDTIAPPASEAAAFARAHHRPNDLYLTAAQDPRDAEKDGATFVDTFRLRAMSAQFITAKTHPYLDREVLEWERRVALADRVYLLGPGGRGGLDCLALSDLVGLYPITGVVLDGPWRAPGAPPCPFLQPRFIGRDAVIEDVVRPLAPGA